MPMFHYTVRDVSGNVKTDMVEALNEQVLVERLQAQGFFIIKFSEALDAIQEQYARKNKITKFQHDKVKLEDLLVFSRQLATMLEAGVALMRSLDVTLAQIQSSKLHAVVKSIRLDVEAGKSFSQALAKHPKVFGQFWISLVEVGEASGTLASVLNKLASHVEDQAAFQASIISAVIYPCVLCVASVGAIVFFALVVAPRFEEIFTAMHAQLPLLTRTLLTVFKFIKQYLLFIAAGFMVIFFMFRSYIKTPIGAIQWEQFIFGLPLIGDIVRLYIMERFNAQMSILVGSGVPILLSLEIVQKLVENRTAFLLIGKVRDEVREGKGLADSMAREEFFPPMTVQMIKVGEETGELAKMLNHVAIYYKNNVEIFVKRFGTVFEPFMLVFMAAVIGVVVVAIFLPLFKLGQGGSGYSGH